MRLPPLGLGLAPTVIGAALALQASPVLPSSGARTLASALALLAAAAAWRASTRRPRLAGALGLCALGAAIWASAASRAADRLEERLAPALEGVVLTVRGVVDALPVATPRGQRFTFRVEGCEHAGTPERDARDDPGPAPALPPDAEPGEVASERTSGEGPGPATGPGTGPGPAAGAAAGVPRPGCTLPPRVSLGWQAGPPRPDAAPVPRVRAGERWSLTVRLARPHAPVNPGAFDRELRWLEEGIGAVGQVRAGRRLDVRVAGTALMIERLRASIRDALFDAAGPERAREAGVLAALAVGDQAAIDPALWDVFNTTGVGHLMSISGMHVTMVGAIGALAAGLAWRSRTLARLGVQAWVPAPVARRFAGVAVAFGYAALAGWGAPAQRTCFMLATGVLLLATRRTASVTAAVGVAAAVIVALDPWAPLAAGFWLSFGAVIAIVWAGAGRRARPAHSGGSVLEALRAAVRTQWAATLALLPLGAWFFASASTVGPLANAFAIPLVGFAVTPLALAGGALGLASPAAASWLVGPAAALLDALIAGLGALAGLPGSSVALPRPSLAAVVAACAGCALLLAPRGLPGRLPGALALLPLATVPIDRPGPGELRLTALDVGQGMAVVVQIERRTLVYDTGPTLGPHLDAGARVLVPWLRAAGVARLDLLVVSHLDDDHSGGARSLLRAVPAEAFASSLPDGHPILAQAPASRRCARGEGWRWGDATFEWLHPSDPPEPARRASANSLSCVLRVKHPAGTVLLAGDVEARQERRLVELFGAQGLAADVLLVPHHGSATSSTDDFLDAVGPGWAIVQAAYRSRFGHPHPRVLARYARRGVEVLRTDADGAVQLRLRPGGPPRVVRSRLEPARYWRVDARPP
jgi:competence protein ComEC